MREIYKEKDFINYIGTNSSSYVDKNFAQIDSIDKTEDYWKFKLTVLEPWEKVYCLGDLVRPIFTEIGHLKNLDFKEEVDKNGNRLYTLENLIVSRFYVYIPILKLHFNSGFCIGDLRYLTLEKFEEKYINLGQLDFDSFHNDFPSVTNLNDLIFEYSKYHDFDIKRICR